MPKTKQNPQARIRELRDKLGLTQEQLAERIGVSHQAVQRYEAGKVKLSFAMAQKIAKALGVSLDDLAGAKTAVGAGPGGGSLDLSADERILVQVHRIVRCPRLLDPLAQFLAKLPATADR
ncbi:MAG: helix-turn-helix transcriptional regulator [Deltaproteobacteria bacterium]|nr:helix-turn-helix transcriptional regulator [Deltaproteobacteria bacterium]